MRRALELARLGLGTTSPNPMVGAVIVRDGILLGEGHHIRAGGPHAEIHALRAAAEAGHDVQGATIYVTLEPCCHHGRTGPCSEALIAAGLGRVVIAQTDPNPLVSGGGIGALRNAGIAVEAGLFASEATDLNRVFSRWISSRRPWVTLKLAMSLDHRISPTGARYPVTGEKALDRVMALRAHHDLILVGGHTAKADDPRLTIRGRDVPRPPLRAVLDARLELPPTAALLSEPGALVITGKSASHASALALREAGAEILTCPLSDTGRIDLDAMLCQLGGRTPPVTSVLVEGGGVLASALLEADLVDELIWFIAPTFFGAGVPATALSGRIEHRFTLASAESLGPDAMLTYRRTPRED